MARTLHIGVLALLAAAAADRRLPVLSLRGGASSIRYQSGRSAVEPSRALVPAEPEMSNAERVFVVQQFERPAVRKAFMQKVYSTVTVQLLLTTAIIALLRASPLMAVRLMSRLGLGMVFLPLLPLFALQYMPNQRQASSPLAYLLLGLFTAFEALSIGSVTAGMSTALLLRAAATTAAATGGLTLYALTTRRDVSASGGLLSGGMWALLVLGGFQMLFGGDWMITVRLAAGVALYMGYLVVNTQMMMGGKKKRQIRPNEHLLAAATLYTDIVSLFMHLATIMDRDERSLR